MATVLNYFGVFGISWYILTVSLCLWDILIYPQCFFVRQSQLGRMASWGIGLQKENSENSKWSVVLFIQRLWKWKLNSTLMISVSPSVWLRNLLNDILVSLIAWKFISAVNNKSRFGLKQVGFGETMSAPGPSPCLPPGWPFTVLFKGYNHFWKEYKTSFEPLESTSLERQLQSSCR